MVVDRFWLLVAGFLFGGSVSLIRVYKLTTSNRKPSNRKLERVPKIGFEGARLQPRRAGCPILAALAAEANLARHPKRHF
jgi:hypothetical protein